MARFRFVMAVLLGLLLLPSLPSVSAEDTVVIDRFNGDLEGATLNFTSSLLNSTLSVDLPPGVELAHAELTVEGVGVNGSPSSILDFDNGVLTTDVWAYSNDGVGIYPPSIDPRTHGWTKISDSEVKSIQELDGESWAISTDGQSAPPFEWPIQLFRFAPLVAGATSVEVIWNGSGLSPLNLTTPSYGEIWMYDHTDGEWDKVASYKSQSSSNEWLNHSIDLPSPYLASDSSFDVAVVGSHSENNLAILPGILQTDYIGLRVTSEGGLQYPSDVNISCDGVGLELVPGNVTDPVTIGDGTDLLANLQTVLDGFRVTPLNVTLVLNFTVGSATAGQLTVRDLLIEYVPLTNTGPVYTGPDSAEVLEDSPWKAVLNLDGVFDDDHNAGDLLFSIPVIDWPGMPLAQFRVGKDAGGNRTLDVQPVSDYFGQLPVTCTVVASDLFGLETSASIDVTVLQKGDPPHLEEVGTIEAHERATTSFTVEVTDVDLPDDEFVFSDDSDLLDIDPGTGEVSWTPTPDQIGEHTFKITVTDRFGYTDWVEVTIVVENSNDPPVITSSPTLGAKQDEETTFIVQTEDPDLPFGDVLSFFAIADAVDVDIDPSTGWMTFTPSNAQVPSFEITVWVQDLIGERDEMVLQVSVENVNDPPVFQEYDELERDQDEEVTFQLAVDDPDTQLAAPLTDVLTFSSVGDEMFSPDVGGLVTFKAGQDMVGTHEVTYTVTDSGGLSDVVVITWIIRDVNDPPVITNQLPDAIDEDEGFNLTMTAVDADGNKVTWADDTDLFDIDPTTGTIDFTPTQEDVGTHQVTLKAIDGWGAEGSAVFTFEVRNVNDDPVIGSVLPPSGSTFDEGKDILFEARATDEDGDALTYTWRRGGKELGSGATLTITDLSAGVHRIVLEVSDGNGGLASQDLQVEVEGSASGNLLLPIAIAAVLAVIVIAFLLARGRGRREGPPVEGSPDGEAGETGPTSKYQEEVVLDYDTEAVTVVDRIAVDDIPLDFGEGELEDVTEVPRAPEEAAIYHLEEAEEYRPKGSGEDGGEPLGEDEGGDGES